MLAVVLPNAENGAAPRQRRTQRHSVVQADDTARQTGGHRRDGPLCLVAQRHQLRHGADRGRVKEVDAAAANNSGLRLASPEADGGHHVRVPTRPCHRNL